MTAFIPLRLKISNILLTKRLKKFTRNRSVQNLKNINSILIISNRSEDLDCGETERLTKYFKQSEKEVFALHYTGKEKDVRGSQLSEIKLFGTDHLNYFFIVKESYIQELMNRDFDLLIDLTLKESFPLKYIYSLSKSKFKVGAGMNYKNKYGDLLIDIEGKPEIPYLITQLKHYLTQLNQNQNVAKV